MTEFREEVKKIENKYSPNELAEVFMTATNHYTKENRPQTKEVKISGNAEQGKITFQQLAQTVANHDEFRFFPSHQPEPKEEPGKEKNDNSSPLAKKLRQTAVKNQIQTELTKNNLKTSDLSTKYHD